MTTKEKPKKVELTPYMERVLREAQEKELLANIRWGKAFDLMDSISEAHSDLEKIKMIRKLIDNTFEQPRFSLGRYQETPEDFLQARRDYHEGRQKMVKAMDYMEKVMLNRFGRRSLALDDNVTNVMSELARLFFDHLQDTDWQPPKKEETAA